MARRNAQVSGMAIAALVLGVLSFILLPCIGAVLALILGLQSLRAINQSSGWLTGRGMAIAGCVLGCVNILLWILIVIVGSFAS